MSPSHPRGAQRATRSLQLACLVLGWLGIAFVVPALLVPARLAPAGRVHAASPATADLVVDFDDGRAVVKRVTLPVTGTLPANGLDVLQRSGVKIDSNGGAICAIDGVGCPAADCFCACKTQADCRYWYYAHGRPDGGWREAATGPAQYTVTSGAVEGWVWGGDRLPLTATAATRASHLAWGWIQAHQSPDGSIAGHGGLTTEAILAARAAGGDLRGLAASGATSASGTHTDPVARGAPSARPASPRRLTAEQRLVTALRHLADDYSQASAAQAGKAAAGAAAGHAAPAFFGIDLAQRIGSRYAAGSGRFGSTVWDQAWSILGLVAAGRPVPKEATSFLRAAAAPGGGWGYSVAADAADADSTGLALQALVGAGEPIASPPIQAGLAFLDRSQQPDGGWGHDGASNANSTAYALEGLLAAGEDPYGARWSLSIDPGPPATTANPVSFLLDQQRPDGHLQYDAYPADLVATLQAATALAGRPLVVPGTGVAAERAVAWIEAQRTADGGFAGYNPGATIEAVLALAALGRDPNVKAPSGRTAADYLAAQAAAYAAKGPSAAGKLCVGIAALGKTYKPRNFGGVDVVAALMATYQPVSGTFGAGGTWDQAWAILGLSAARAPIPGNAVAALLAAASPKGGWGFDAAADAPDVDSTALALQALRAGGGAGTEAGGAATRAVSPAVSPAASHAAGRAANRAANRAADAEADSQADAEVYGLTAGHPAVRAGVAALRRMQNPDGGFAGYDGATNVTSTALALAALTAWGQQVDGPGWMRGPEGGLLRSAPLDALMAGQSPQGGFAGFAGPDDPGAAYAAVFALAGRTLPLDGPAPQPSTRYLPNLRYRR